MSTQFSIYYSSPENQAYLRQIIEASGAGNFPVVKNITRSGRGSSTAMSTQFNIYYNSLENKEYLRQIIEASDTGNLVESNDLAHLPAEAAPGVDVVFLEYQENNPELDHWIERIVVNPKSPAIFLYFKEISTDNLWKALRLGAKECFTFPIQEEDFQQAVKRLVARTEVRKISAKPTQVISFLGCKGGVGTSFLVANLASLLAQERRARCWWWTWIWDLPSSTIFSMSTLNIP